MATSSKYSSFLKDPSAWLLLASNLVTIYFVLTGDINFITVLWIYWFQSVIIGIFNFIRILELRDYTTEGFKVNGQSVEPSYSLKIKTAFFFLIHYGLFHSVYIVFLLFNSHEPLTTDLYRDTPFAVGAELSVNLEVLFIAAGAFFINHLFSYLYNRRKEKSGKDIGTVAFYPYARIMPMHIAILFSSLFSGFLLPFLLLKTGADIVMHSVEHKKFRGD